MQGGRDDDDEEEVEEVVLRVYSRLCSDGLIPAVHVLISLEGPSKHRLKLEAASIATVSMALDLLLGGPGASSSAQ